MGHCQVGVERTGSAADETMTQTSDSDTRHLPPDAEGPGAQQAMVDGAQEVTTDTQYWASSLGNRQLYPGQPFNVMATVRIRTN